MNLSTLFPRIFFTILSVFMFASFSIGLQAPEFSLSALMNGAALGLCFAGFLFFVEYLFKGFNIRTLNTVALGLFFGYLLGSSTLVVFNALAENIPHVFSPQILSMIKNAVFLFSCYLGLILTLQASDKLHFSIPFVQFIAEEKKKKDILLDPALLNDYRLLDLARSGLLDHQLLLPISAIEELRLAGDSPVESIRNKAKFSLEILKKLEALPCLNMRFAGQDFSDTKEPIIRLIGLAKYLDANILSSEVSKISPAEMEGVKIININLISQALKPLATPGEHIQITVQRYGKEPRQGVGYLDDGTMVVVNGGAQYIGKTIKVVVLSVKPTSSGQMIFCNAMDLTIPLQETLEQVPPDLENSHGNYYSV